MVSSSLLKVQHTSLQFDDSPRQQEHDVRALFSRGKGYPIKTGTEAGPETATHNLLIKYAAQFDHDITFSRECWVAVDRSIIKKGTVKRGEVFLADNDAMVGHGHDRVIATFTFTHKNSGIGRVSQGVTHYPTRGGSPGDPNYELNKAIAKKSADWMKEAARGTALAFLNGDFNMNDRTLNWDFGQGYTSMADELGAWQNTGHGPIDGMASYDKDGRVSAGKFVVMDDRRFFMNSDHYLCRGTWRVKNLAIS